MVSRVHETAVPRVNYVLACAGGLVYISSLRTDLILRTSKYMLSFVAIIPCTQLSFNTPFQPLRRLQGCCLHACIGLCLGCLGVGCVWCFVRRMNIFVYLLRSCGVFAYTNRFVCTKNSRVILLKVNLKERLVPKTVFGKKISSANEINDNVKKNRYIPQSIRESSRLPFVSVQPANQSPLDHLTCAHL